MIQSFVSTSQGTLTTLVISDTALVDDVFLVYLSDFLTRSESLPLFGPEERQECVEAVRARVRLETGRSLSTAECWDRFRDDVRANVTLLLAFSPADPMFKVRNHRFPAVYERVVVNRFNSLDRDALYEVASNNLTALQVATAEASAPARLVNDMPDVVDVFFGSGRGLALQTQQSTGRLIVSDGAEANGAVGVADLVSGARTSILATSSRIGSNGSTSLDRNDESMITAVDVVVERGRAAAAAAVMASSSLVNARLLESVAAGAASIHLAVRAVAEGPAGSNRQIHITPRSFVELLEVYQHLLVTRRSDIEARIQQASLCVRVCVCVRG